LRICIIYYTMCIRIGCVFPNRRTMKRIPLFRLTLLLTGLLTACNLVPVETGLGIVTETPSPVPPERLDLPVMSVLSILPGQEVEGNYIRLMSGGDVDTEVTDGSRRTGGGETLPAEDGNTVPDTYMQFDIDDLAFFGGQPTTSVRVDIEYLDEGTDTFTLQYDAVSGGPYGNGTFVESRPEVKRNSGEYRTATFILKDVHFSNRDNGSDIRLSDMTDGVETIRRVAITLLPIPVVINVDECGADPFDEIPDSRAIQECLNKAKSGDIVTFTSGENTPGYQGYLIDRTIFLVISNPQPYLTFTSTDPANPALLKATSDLKGFVMKLFPRSLGVDPAKIDYLTLSYLHLDGNREERECFGEDGIANGLDDNWGSSLTECSEAWDPWCNPGGLDLPGAEDWEDETQAYEAHPDRWTTGLLVEGMHITNIECGTAFGMGGAGAVLIGNVIEDAGDHVHAAGCAQIDDEEGVGDWSDGITFDGPAHLVLQNTVVNPTDIGIVFFGGRLTVIRGNTVHVTGGNHGAFGGIAVHPWGLGDVSFGQVANNIVISEGDETCGGIHAGINLGGHMWGGACWNNAVTPVVGLPGCMSEPSPPRGALCPDTGQCQLWASIAEDATYLLAGNSVRGAHIGYLVEGLDIVGELIEHDNVSETPRRSDWDAARNGCGGIVWGPLDKVAHHPSLPGWTDKRVHCER
jgi:hypothetical protein